MGKARFYTTVEKKFWCRRSRFRSRVQTQSNEAYGGRYGAGCNESDFGEEKHYKIVRMVLEKGTYGDDTRYSQTFVPTDGCMDNTIFQVGQLCIDYPPLYPHSQTTIHSNWALTVVISLSHRRSNSLIHMDSLISAILPTIFIQTRLLLPTSWWWRWWDAALQPTQRYTYYWTSFIHVNSHILS